MLVLVLACITPDAEYERMRRRVMDSDLDGYVVEDYRQRFEDEPEDWMLGMDCDDEDADIHPGMDEVAYNEIDDDCDPDTFDDDADGDGFRLSDEIPDCDDDDPAVNPGAEEVCDNGIDDDCDGGPGPCTWEGVKSLDDAVEVEGFCPSGGLCWPGIVTDLGFDGANEWIWIDDGESDDAWSVHLGYFADGAFVEELVPLAGQGVPSIGVIAHGLQVTAYALGTDGLELVQVAEYGGAYSIGDGVSIASDDVGYIGGFWLLDHGEELEAAGLFEEHGVIALADAGAAGEMSPDDSATVRLGGASDVRFVLRADTDGSGIAEVVVAHAGSEEIGVISILDDVSLSSVASPRVAVDGEVSGDQFGHQILKSDYNGDGYDDLAVVSLSAQGGASGGGLVTVLMGDTLAPERSLRVVSDESAALPPFLGVLAAADGDLLVISAPFYGGTGETLLVDPNSTGTVGFADVDDRIGPGDRDGVMFPPLGADLDNDGQEDLVLTRFDTTTLSTEAYLVFGASM